jgi:hypothetical protein
MASDLFSVTAGIGGGKVERLERNDNSSSQRKFEDFAAGTAAATTLPTKALQAGQRMLHVL